jgi:uncharacterized protein
MKHVTIPVEVVLVFFLLVPFLFGQEIAVTPQPTFSPRDLLEVTVHGLIVDPAGMQPVVLLVDPSEGKVMPIWIGPSEAMAIQGELDGTKPPRPMTHDLLEQVVRRLGGVVRRIIITQEKENIYYAIVVLEKDRTLIEVDARPSDSIAMALKFKVPILISRSLFKEKAVLLRERENSEERYGLSVQEVTAALAASFSFKEGNGILVADVKEGSRAEKDGMERGDILVEIGEQRIGQVEAMRKILVEMKGPVTIKLFRKGSFVTVTLSPAN